MLKPITLEVDGIKFQIAPLGLQSALKLDKKLITIVAPLIGITGTDENLDTAIGKLQDKIPQILGSLTDSEFQEIINLTLHTTILLRDGFPPAGLDEPGNREIFAGSLLTLYKLCFEIWRYNKLTVFQVAAKGQVSTGGLV